MKSDPGEEAESRVCTECGDNPAAPGKSTCRECQSARRRKHRVSCREASRCPRDGRPVEPGKARCRQCNTKLAAQERERYAARAKRGGCPRCGRDPDTVDGRFRRGPDCRYCPPCFFSETSRSHFGVRSFGKVLLEMFLLQHSRCALTGVDLVLGENTSLDHRMPRSRGGANAVTNAQWVSRSANQMKGRLTNEEFISQSRLVLDWSASPEYAKVQRRLRRRTSGGEKGR